MADDDIPPEIPLQSLLDAEPDRPVTHIRTVDCADLWSPFAAARDAAEAAGETDHAAAYNLLASACSLILRADEPVRPFAPMFELVTGGSPHPDAFKGAQAFAFAELAPTIRHLALRARLADLGWVLGRRPDSAHVAAEAYLEGVKMLLTGRARTRGDVGEASGTRGLDLLRRACVLERQLTGGKDQSEKAVTVARRVRQQAARLGDLFGFVRAAELELEFGTSRPLTLARAAERLISRAQATPSERDLGPLWSLAATAFARAARKGEADRMLLALAEWQVRTADRLARVPMQEVHWLEKAILTLRRFKGTNERRAELQTRLVRAQGNVLDFMVPITSKMDVKEPAELVLAELAGKSLVDALLILAKLTRSPPIDALRQSAVKSLRASPFAGLFAPVIFDAKGKTVARLPAVDFGRPPDERNIRLKIIEHEEMRRAITVAGLLEPARQQIMFEHRPDERWLTQLASLSPLVPPNHEMIVGKGFAHYLNGDIMEAAHLLIPQLEPGLRHLLASADVETTRFKPDLTQSSATLSVLLDPGGELRQPLEELVGPEMVFEIDNLFDRQEGPALRHRMAHGILSQWFFVGRDINYACWLVFRLVMIWLVPHCDEIKRQIGEP